MRALTANKIKAKFKSCELLEKRFLHPPFKNRFSDGLQGAILRPVGDARKRRIKGRDTHTKYPRASFTPLNDTKYISKVF